MRLALPEVCILHLDRHHPPVLGLGPKHLGEAGRGDRLVLERLKQFKVAPAKVLPEDALHLVLSVPVEGLVLEDLERIQVLLGQYVVHVDQALAELDVQAAVGEAAGQDARGGARVDLVGIRKIDY